MSNNPGNQMYSVPFKCKDYADYLRAVEVTDILNRVNDDFPIVVVLGSGPKDSRTEGVRYCDIQCASMAKIQHFMEAGQDLDHNIAKLTQDLKLRNPKFEATKSPMDPLAGMFGPELSEAINRLKEQQERARRLRGDNGPSI